MGLALLGSSNYGAALWVPTFFIRSWEMDRSGTGIASARTAAHHPPHPNPTTRTANPRPPPTEPERK